MSQEKSGLGNADKTAKKSNSAAEIVHLRNRFFYIYFRKVLLILFISLGLCLVSLASCVFFASRKTPPVYLPTTTDGRIVRTYPLNMPSVANKELMDSIVQKWALDASLKLYNYDYLNYRNQISQAQNYFTLRGWQSYIQEFTASQNINTVVQQMAIVTFIPLQPPVIKEERIIEGRLAWALEFPAQMRFVVHDGKKTGFVQNGVVHMVVIRVSSVDSPKGIAIDQVGFKEN